MKNKILLILGLGSLSILIQSADILLDCPLLGVYNNQQYNFMNASNINLKNNLNILSSKIVTKINPNAVVSEYFVIEEPITAQYTYNIVTHYAIEQLIRDTYKSTDIIKGRALNFNFDVDIGLFTYKSGGIKAGDVQLNDFKSFNVNKHDNVYYSPDNAKFTLEKNRKFIFFTVAVYVDKEYKNADVTTSIFERVKDEDKKEEEKNLIKGLDFKKSHLVVGHFFITFDKELYGFVRPNYTLNDYISLLTSELQNATSGDKLALQEALDVLNNQAPDSAAAQPAPTPVPVPQPIPAPAPTPVQKGSVTSLEEKIRDCLTAHG